MKVMTIVGTRPDLIKMWSVLKKLDQLNFEHIFVHTGQNSTKELKDFFFDDLELRQPDYYLDIDTSSYGKEVADVIRKSDELLQQVKPDALLVLGDTFSCLSVLPASHRGIKIFHMEAGLRAWDKRMPEQRNRILIDHMSDILLPFHPHHRDNLIREDIHPSKIFITGNPTFEPMRHFQEQIKASPILKKLKIKPKEYIAMTAHRSENVDDPKTLQALLDGAGLVAKKLKVEVIYPMHPRTKSKMRGIRVPKGVRIISPLGFYDFNNLQMNALCLMADSGTTPEEGLFYKVPCVSLRKSCERYETIEAGAHIVSGTQKEQIAAAVQTAVKLPWNGRYDFCLDYSPANVVINVLQSQMQHFFE
jgi:UDP-N-acetylglucosamine 2-epimerase (non-hydrolysing)